jgi:uncharacterized Zn-finger protein
MCDAGNPVKDGDMPLWCAPRVTAAPQQGSDMAASTIPHLANDLGVEKIFVGVKELNCMGARSPYDHPHVYLDMGAESQILCPYCSTLYVHDPRLEADETEPKGCVVALDATTG